VKRERTPIVFVVLILIAAAIYAGIALQPYTHYPQNSPVSTDAFYYFSIAENLVAGRGLTHDGTVTTNGFQPLYQALLVPLFALAPDKYAAVNGALLLALLCHLGSVLLLRAWLRQRYDRATATIAAALWACSPVVARQMLNGMETPLVVLALVALLYVYATRIRPRPPSALPARWALGTGALAGFAYLARVDLALVLLAFAADYIWAHRRSPWRAKPRSACSPVLLVALAALLVMLPWTLYSWLAFGDPVPKSAEASRLLAHYASARTPAGMWAANLGRAATTLAYRNDPLLGTLTLAGERVLSASAAQALSTAATLLGAMLLAAGLRLTRLAGVRLLFAAAALLAWLYPVVVPANWFYPRYLVLVTLLFAGVYAELLARLSAAGPRWRRASTACVALFLVGCLGLDTHYLRTAHPHAAYQGAIDWIERETDARHDRIGIYQAEIVPYYIENRFINLDGKCNADAMQALIEKRAFDFAREAGVDYIVDRNDVLNALLFRRSAAIAPEALEKVHSYTGSGQQWTIYALRRDPRAVPPGSAG